jgi:hypothetical protein
VVLAGFWEFYFCGIVELQQRKQAHEGKHIPGGNDRKKGKGKYKTNTEILRIAGG